MCGFIKTNYGHCFIELIEGYHEGGWPAPTRSALDFSKQRQNLRHWQLGRTLEVGAQTASGREADHLNSRLNIENLELVLFRFRYMRLILVIIRLGTLYFCVSFTISMS